MKTEVMLVDVIKEKETGTLYLIPHNDPLPNDDMYIRLEVNISEDDAIQKYKLGRKVNPKQRC